MKRVYSNESLADAGHIRALLEQQGIRCFIKHEQLSGALGEVPFLECMPEVWIYDDTELARAEAVVEEVLRPDVGGDAWQCGKCGETNEAQFAACWNCGAGDGPN